MSSLKDRFYKISLDMVDKEAMALLPESFYLLISSFLLSIIKTSALIWFPLLFAAYSAGNVMNPMADLFIALTYFACDVCWSKFCHRIDVPSTSSFIQEFFYTLYRSPYSLSTEGLKPRFWSFVIKGTEIVVVICGYALGIYTVTSRTATTLDTNTGSTDIGQPHFTNIIMSRGTTMVFVIFIETIRGLISTMLYLGDENSSRFWPRWEHQSFVASSPLKATVEAIIATFSVPALGGFITYEFVIATAIVSGYARDTGIFVGMLLLGSVLALAISWVGYTFPAFRRWYAPNKSVDSDPKAVASR